MFENLGDFSAVFWFLTAVMVFLILFEKPLIALEEKRIEARKAVIKELRYTVSDQEKIIYIQDKIIDGLFANNVALGGELSTQNKINSINLETLRQERLMRVKEKNNGKDK